jgi:hypothetical protein
MEANMRLGGLVGVIVLVWLLIGVVAAWQRDYFKSGDPNCATAARTALTVLAGPLNYVGLNPKPTCNVKVPQPSSSGMTLPDQAVALTIGVSS